MKPFNADDIRKGVRTDNIPMKKNWEMIEAPNKTTTDKTALYDTVF